MLRKDVHSRKLLVEYLLKKDMKSYGSVNHDGGQERLLASRDLADSLSGTVNRLGVVVCTLCTSSKNDVNVRVTLEEVIGKSATEHETEKEEARLTSSPHDSCQTAFGNTKESMRVRSGPHSVDSDSEGSISTVLETDRARGTRSKLPVKLRFYK